MKNVQLNVNLNEKKQNQSESEWKTLNILDCLSHYLNYECHKTEESEIFLRFSEVVHSKSKTTEKLSLWLKCFHADYHGSRVFVS